MNPTCKILKLRFKLDSANVPLRQYGRGSVKCNLNTAPHCLIRGQWLLLSLRSTPLYDTILSTRSMNILQGVRAWYTYFSLQYESSVEVVGVDRCLRRRRSIVLFTRFTSDFFCRVYNLRRRCDTLLSSLGSIGVSQTVYAIRRKAIFVFFVIAHCSCAKNKINHIVF